MSLALGNLLDSVLVVVDWTFSALRVVVANVVFWVDDVVVSFADVLVVLFLLAVFVVDGVRATGGASIPPCFVEDVEVVSAPSGSKKMVLVTIAGFLF
jgi:hypothetical protein